MSGRPSVFDPAPVLALFGDASDGEIADRLGVAPDTVKRWRTGRNGISPRLADRIAVELGLHLDILWPRAAA